MANPVNALLQRLQPLTAPPIWVWEYILVALLLGLGLGRGVAAIDDALFPEKYAQLVVGNITWGVGSKRPDYLILLGFFVGFFAVYLGLRLLAAAIQRVNGKDAEASLRQLCIYALLPASVWMGNACTNHQPILDWVIVSTALVLLVLLFSWAALGRRIPFPSQPAHREAISSSVLVVLLAALSGIALSLALGRLNLNWQFSRDGVILTAIASVGLVSLCLLRIWSPKKNPEKNDLAALLQSLRLLLGMAQLFLPLCFLVALPEPWARGEQKFWGYPITPALYLSLALLMGWTYVDLLTRMRRSVGTVISPLCLAAVLLYLKAPLVGVSHLSSDDYHWGEFLLPWSLLQDFHLLPFVDYEPARGLVNYLPGLLANFAINGDAASYMAVVGKGIFQLPFLTIAFLVIARSIGLLPAFLGLMLMPSPGGLFEIDLLVTMGLCILAEAFLNQRRVAWLGLWVVTCLGLVLFAPGNGGLLMLSTLPLAGIVFYQAVRSQPQQLLRGAIGLAIGLLLLHWFTPLGAMLIGAFRYGIEQSSLNSVSYGIEWFKSRSSNPMLSYPLWELVRSSWIGVSVLIGLLIYQRLIHAELPNRRRFFVFAMPILIITLLLIPRSAGRIDPGSMSRLGNTSVWVVCLLLPLVLLAVYKPPRNQIQPIESQPTAPQWQPLILISLALVGGLLGSFYEPLVSLERLVLHPSVVNQVADLALVNGQQVGMPRLQNAMLEPAHLQRLQQTRAILNRLLEPGETYLDLTNRNAQYFYWDYPVPIASGAVYNLVHRNQQLRSLQSLERIQPPVVLADPQAIFAEGGAALRAHLIYRYVVERYVPVAIDPLILLLKPDRLDRLERLKSLVAIGNTEAIQLDATKLEATKLEATKLNLLDRVFRVANLEGIPSSWGQSLGSLQGEIQLVKEMGATIQPSLQSVTSKGGDRYQVTGPQPSLKFDLTALHLNGRDAGLLAFDFSCKRHQSAPLQISWESASAQPPDPDATLQFRPRRGKQLVPLDAFPRWLLAKNLTSVRIELPDPDRCSSFSFANPALYQRSHLGVK